MKTLCLSLLAFTLILSSTKSLRAQKKADKDISVFVKLNALSLLDPNYPTIQPGVEGRYKSISIGYKYGPAIDILSRKVGGTEGALVSYNGHKQKLDVRYWGRKYVFGLEAFTGAFKKEKERGKFYDNRHEYEFSYEYYKQKIDIWGIAFKSGYVFNLNRFFLDASATIGIRSRTITNQEARNVQIRELDFSDKEWIHSYKDTEGTRKTPHFTIELNVGYKLF